MTLADVASRLGVSVRTVEREIRDGRLRAIRVRGAVRILESDVTAYIASQQIRPVRIVRPGPVPKAPWD